MKKTITIALLAASLFVAHQAQAQLGVYAGYTPENMVADDESTQFNGFFAGVNYNFGLTGNIKLSAGLQVRQNTLTTSDSFNLGSFLSTQGKATHTQTLLEVPLLLNFGTTLQSNVRITLFAGPTFSYALKGNTHTNGSISVAGLPIGGSSDYDWYGDNSNREKLNIMGTAGVMVTFTQVRLYAGYNYGFSDLDTRDDHTLKTKGLFAGLGFAF